MSELGSQLKIDKEISLDVVGEKPVVNRLNAISGKLIRSYVLGDEKILFTTLSATCFSTASNYIVLENEFKRSEYWFDFTSMTWMKESKDSETSCEEASSTWDYRKPLPDGWSYYRVAIEIESVDRFASSILDTTWYDMPGVKLGSKGQVIIAGGLQIEFGATEMTGANINDLIISYEVLEGTLWLSINPKNTNDLFLFNCHKTGNKFQWEQLYFRAGTFSEVVPEAPIRKQLSPWTIPALLILSALFLLIGVQTTQRLLPPDTKDNFLTLVKRTVNAGKRFETPADVPPEILPLTYSFMGCGVLVAFLIAIRSFRAGLAVIEDSSPYFQTHLDPCKVLRYGELIFDDSGVRGPQGEQLAFGSDANLRLQKVHIESSDFDRLSVKTNYGRYVIKRLDSDGVHVLSAELTDGDRLVCTPYSAKNAYNVVENDRNDGLFGLTMHSHSGIGWQVNDPDVRFNNKVQTEGTYANIFTFNSDGFFKVGDELVALTTVLPQCQVGQFFVSKIRTRNKRLATIVRISSVDESFCLLMNYFSEPTHGGWNEQQWQRILQ